MHCLKKLKKNCPNQPIITSVIYGYLTGFILSLIWFLFFMSSEQKANFSITKWIIFSVLTLLIFLLFYSRDIRCTLSLAIPILCSSKGRSLTIALAFFVAAFGPSANIIDNVDIMAASLSCGQLKLKEALGRMLDVMKRPLVAIKESVMAAMQEIRKVMESVKIVLIRIREAVLVLLAGIRNAFHWLHNIVRICNKEFGTPFERCMHTAEKAMANCRAKLGAIQELCQVTNFFKLLCYSVKFIDAICILVDFFNEAIINTALERLHRFTEQLKKMFEVTVTFDHDFYFSTIVSKDFQDIEQEVLSDVRKKINFLFIIFGILNVVSSVLLVLVIFKALYFKVKYSKSLRFQNTYLTKDFYAIDGEHKSKGMETVLPLKRGEKRKYIKLTSCRLTSSELRKMARSMLFLMISCIQLFSICFTDYSIYWLLAMLSYHGHQNAGLEAPPYITVQVEGGGFVSDIFRGIVHAFEPITQIHDIDLNACLPLPKQPNYLSYLEIAGLCLLAWILLICQPYGLRLRHVIMRFYFPEIARKRAEWLHERILRKRKSFFKFARRRARVRHLNDKSTKSGLSSGKVKAKNEGSWLCRLLFGTKHDSHCILCDKHLLATKKIVCQNSNCKAVYCSNCYRELGSKCCLCQKPSEFGDLSDISEERDSSDDPSAVKVYSDDEKLCP